jgi:peptidoglycan/xylan/chitin deacetylase (PgdA/CDA1 family)
LTPTWVYNEPGQVVAPILLYHRVEGTTTDSRYSVPVPVFRAQMQALHDWGYTAIPISLLLDALTEGAPLPEKPVVITFDDGNLNIYENAFPIMQEYGYPGVFYIIARNINVGTNVVHVPELEEMIAAGWEVGSHSYNHPDLAANHALIPYEVGQSKADLEAALGVEIQTFAYPYGTIDPYLESQVRRYGYRGGMGLGTSWTHTLETLFYLSRIEVYSSYTMDDFAARLPWKPR